MSSTTIGNTIKFSTTSIGAAGSLKVNQQSVLGTYVMDKDNLPLFLDRVNGGGATQNYSNGEVAMGVSALNDYAICQTYKRHLYLAGKAQMVELTFANMGIVADVTKRVGAFNADATPPYDSAKDGFWLEMDGVQHKLVISKAGTGVTTILRSNWNDPLDGTGPSGVTIDFDDFTVMAMDYLYLGGTALGLFFQKGRTLHLAHIFEHSSSGFNTTFLDSPVQPLRWEIRSSGGVASLSQICGTVTTGGALDIVGFPRSIDDNTPVQANSVGTVYLGLAIRLSDPKQIAFDFFGNALAITNDNYILRWYLNPTFSVAPTWISPGSGGQLDNTGLEYTFGAATGITLTGGTRLAHTFGKGDTTKDLKLDGLFQLGTGIAGNSDILALGIEPLTSNLDIYPGTNFNVL